MELFKKTLDENYTRMLRAVFNKSWKQQPTKQYLYGHSPPILQAIQIRRTRHAGHCWKCKDELISEFSWGLPLMDRPLLTNWQRLS